MRVWRSWFPDPETISAFDELTFDSKPWFFQRSELDVDDEIAATRGKYVWQFYAETTPQQRLLLRMLLYVRSYREDQIHKHYERHRPKPSGGR